MKIVLVALNAKYVHSNLAVYDLEAYAGEKLKQQAGEAKFEIVVREYTINHNLDSILQSIYKEKADVIAFSCYIWNIHEVLTIAGELCKVAHNCRIWLGGPEVSYDSERLLADNSFIEGVIIGEGEQTFYELAVAWQEDGGKPCQGVAPCGVDGSGTDDADIYADIKGIAYRSFKGEIIRTPARPLIPLDEVPFIYDGLERFENRILYYETSRGCPFSCSYCLSSIDKTVRFRSLSLVKRELQFFLDGKVPQVKFVDRTFNCNREHALAVWRYITENDNGVTNFHFEVSADLFSGEELDLFARMRPGLIQLEIGLQSTNPDTIREIKRTMDVARVKENMLAINKMGNIHQHLDLIAGLPYEDFVTFKQSFNDAYEMKPNQLQLGFLKVLKGSYMEERAEEYELRYQGVQPYEVMSTKWITYDEILTLKNVEEMVEVYYNSDQFEHTLPYILSFFESPFSFYEALGKYYESHSLFDIGFKREARYGALLDFYKERFGKSDKILHSLLCYDYYLRENAKSRPSWAKAEPIERELYQKFFKQGGTEELRIDGEGYDSKAAARKMHIEPVCGEALPWITSGVKNVTAAEKQDLYYCIFDYEKRNPLSKGARVTILQHL